MEFPILKESGFAIAPEIIEILELFSTYLIAKGNFRDISLNRECCSGVDFFEKS